MPNEIRDIRTVHPEDGLVLEKNVSVHMSTGDVIRCNVFKPKTSNPAQKFPAIVTMGPYGKDVEYKYFHPASFAEVNPEHQTKHAAWELPTPEYWTRHGYVVVRGDEIGTGQSPGKMNVFSAASVECYHELIEWVRDQEWCTGKIGLLGISYYATQQWKVAARQPKGLVCAIPWEGFTDTYRDAARHGGIMSDGFFNYWYPRQVLSNQYGLPGRATRNWGDDTIEGDLSADELAANRVDIIDYLAKHPYRDDDQFAAVNVNLRDIKIPILTVANWGGFLLHLRGNVEGFLRSGSELKYIRFIVGRHDLPFYYPEEVELQRSFLDAFCKNDDRVGWSRKGEVAPVDLLLRKGNPGYNNAEAEKAFPRRFESEWPIARTQYTNFHLHPDGSLLTTAPTLNTDMKRSYKAPGKSGSSDMITFTTPPFQNETEITGHIVAHLNVSMSGLHGSPMPSELDVFVTLRHFDEKGKEIYYTGTTGEAAPVTKGWLRFSLRKTNESSATHEPWLPHRDYYSSDYQPVIPNDIYPVDIEVWPTNVVVGKGGALQIEISAGDTHGVGLFSHSNKLDRPEEKLLGLNHVHFGPKFHNYVTLPVIPAKED
ncbi:alpha/beta-hydrolase [Aspergillus costaricaensis CBS 115574]|uniref:Alpha/beta-hydrolase n=1 Tax=Aspergillus costaricaensis CBS 115574 TaxID=1448317 RepID=A0ACD1ISV0_9EURO|nr:alpha/beta-hydrolase [Aspergillus costaricaensis CBS 115574]RAK93768.1 alpha/beta-hydrolase [Aspergillus costaricaensis CBS 115574]